MSRALLVSEFDRIVEAPKAIPELRSFVLDLAVRGKLVPHDGANDSAAHLLDRIHSDYERLVRAGKLRSRARMQPVQPGAAAFPIPSGWAWSRLLELCEKTGSGSTPAGGKSAYTATGIPFLRSQNVHDEGLELTDVALISPQIHESMRGTVVYPRDLLLNITGGSIGRCALVGDEVKEANVSQHVAIIRPVLRETAPYLHIAVRSPYFQAEIEAAQTGAGREGLPKKKLDFIPIPVPPLPEQARIVSRVKELMALCDRLEAAYAEREEIRRTYVGSWNAKLRSSHASTESLAHLPRVAACRADIKRLSETILTLAVSGRLSADWRATHSDVEPAGKLLQRIAAEKARLVAAKKIRADKKLPDIRLADTPFDVPSGWTWCRMGDAGIFQRGKSKHRPRNDPKLFEQGDIPFVQTGDVSRSKQSGFKIQTCTGYYNTAGLAQSRLWPAATLCVTIAANIAETGFLTFPACIPDSVVAFTPAVEGETPQYIQMFIHLTRTAIERFAPATAQKNINLEIINELMLPLPPLNEQAVIVARVKALMATCHALEVGIEQCRTHAGDLLQAVLKEAFAST